jgi:hypothetical protein
MFRSRHNAKPKKDLEHGARKGRASPSGRTASWAAKYAPIAGSESTLETHKPSLVLRLVHLHRLDALEDITLLQTSVTAAGVQQLRAALPDCEIYWDGYSLSPSASNSLGFGGGVARR